MRLVAELPLAVGATERRGVVARVQLERLRAVLDRLLEATREIARVPAELPGVRVPGPKRERLRQVLVRGLEVAGLEARLAPVLPGVGAPWLEADRVIGVLV